MTATKVLHIAQRQLQQGFAEISHLDRYVASLIRRFRRRCSKNGIDGILSAVEGLLIFCLDEEMERLFERRPFLFHRRVVATADMRAT